MISPPPGYRALVPLDRERHRSLGVASNAACFVDQLSFIYLEVIEFVRASRYLPIVFTRDAAGELVPGVQTGIEASRNLFVDEAGRWDPGVYCPAYVRRYPFYFARVVDGAEDQRLVCVDEAGLDARAPHLFDAQGQPTAAWDPIDRMMIESTEARSQTTAFCAKLLELDLLEAFSAEFRPTGGEPKRVGGLLRISEDRLCALAPDVLSDLLRNGWLPRIYAHLFSLENYGALVDRYVSRTKPLG